MAAVRDAYVVFVTVVNGECERICFLILLLPDPKHAINVGVMQKENWVEGSHLVCTHVTICSFNWTIPFDVALGIKFHASIFISFWLCESTYGHMQVIMRLLNWNIIATSRGRVRKWIVICCIKAIFELIGNTRSVTRTLN